MKLTILITGSTDGIGFKTAEKLLSLGHTVLVHGRSDKKLADSKATLSKLIDIGSVETYQADLSQLAEVERLAAEITSQHERLDVLINNAGVFKVPNPVTESGLDIRFIVNVIAPYLLTKRVFPLMSNDSRIINLSSAAQAPVNLDAFAGSISLSDDQAYAQSKLAITMWSFWLAQSISNSGPSVIAVNPASFLASKMVKEAYGLPGNDLSIGADILVRAALNDDFANASGRYFDNDQQKFSDPHPDALDAGKNERLVASIEKAIEQI